MIEIKLIVSGKPNLCCCHCNYEKRTIHICSRCLLKNDENLKSIIHEVNEILVRDFLNENGIKCATEGVPCIKLRQVLKGIKFEGIPVPHLLSPYGLGSLQTSWKPSYGVPTKKTKKKRKIKRAKPKFCIGTIKNPTDSDSHARGGKWSVNCINQWVATLGNKLTVENAIFGHNIIVIHEITHVLSGEHYCWSNTDPPIFWDSFIEKILLELK